MIATEPGTSLMDRLLGVYAEERIAELLEDIIISALHPCPRELDATCDWTCLDGVVRAPVAAATRKALDTLATELATSLDDAPGELLEHLARQRIRFELGCE
jgi:hypothetical protein